MSVHLYPITTITKLKEQRSKALREYRYTHEQLISNVAWRGNFPICQ